VDCITTLQPILHTH